MDLAATNIFTNQLHKPTTVSCETMPKRHLKQTKRARIDVENQRLEEELAADVFGRTKFLSKEDRPKKDKNDDAFPFEIDRVGEAEEHPRNDDGEPPEEESNGETSVQEATDTPAWVDPDDLHVSLVNNNSRLRKLRKRPTEDTVSSDIFESRLRERFENTTQLTARTDWAALDHPRDEDHNVSNVLTSADALMATQRPLPPNILNLERCADLNMDEPNNAVVQAIDFHNGSDPDRPIAVTAGLDKTLRFFQVTVDKSEKIHGIHCTSTFVFAKISPHVSSSQTAHYECVLFRLDRNCCCNRKKIVLLLVRFRCRKVGFYPSFGGT